MIFCTGDTHQGHDIAKLKYFAQEGGKELTKDDYVIICGDFGLLWNYQETGEYMPSNPADAHWTRRERELYDWYNELPWTTLWVDGNHESFDRLDSYPISEWHGGRVQKISDSIIHLMRGEIFELEGKTILTFGGAQSTDRGFVTHTEDFDEHRFWWRQEIPSIAEYNHAVDNLKKHDYKVDYIITHDCPFDIKQVIYEITFDSYGNTNANAVSAMLNSWLYTVDFTHWYCGHLHMDRDVKNVSVLYQDIVPLVQEDMYESI